MGLCTAVAMVFAWVESLLPPLIAAVPGIKLGLPNIAIIFILYRFGVKEAAAVSLTRIIAVSLLFGNPMTMAYSLAGGFLSLTVMAVLRKWNILSIVGVSVAGGVFHNAGQIICACIIKERSIARATERERVVSFFVFISFPHLPWLSVLLF